MKTYIAVAATVFLAAALARTASAQPYYDPYAVQRAYYAEMQRRAWLQQQYEAELVRRMQEQRALAERQMEEQQAAEAAALELTMYGPGRINTRVQWVIGQLEQHSGMSFQVVPSQRGNWGQAHNGGLIWFDWSSAVQPESVMAFRLAHEWGHEAMGHSANIYNPTGPLWRRVSSPTELEDEADEYAGEFLCTYGYDVKEVMRALRRYPGITGDSHSSGQVRAENVLRGCQRVSNEVE